MDDHSLIERIKMENVISAAIETAYQCYRVEWEVGITSQPFGEWMVERLHRHDGFFNFG